MPMIPAGRADAVLVADADRGSAAGTGRKRHASRDVWRFDLRSRQWQVLSEDGTPGGPQPSQHGAVLISPSDGAINVLPGSTDDGSVQPAW